MYIKSLSLIILLLQIFKQVSCLPYCSDCVLYTNCKAAEYRATYEQNNETKDLFTRALCGREIKDGIPVPKVCCSAFPPLKDLSNRIAEVNNLANKERLLPKECGKIQGDRIFGGKKANLYEFPWMTLISYLTRDDHVQFQCGGSIINSRYILTAAHCVSHKRIAGVRVGEFDISSKEDCEILYEMVICETHTQDIYVEKVIIHPNYQIFPVVKNDIALLRVQDVIDFGFANVAPICLPTTEELRNLNIDHKIATVAGWGITEYNNESPYLLKVDIPIKNASQCSGLYNRNAAANIDYVENQFCAGEINKDSCSGDSGGPLMLKEKYFDFSRYVQYGIVSHGPKQCGTYFPGVYTDVRKFVDWILENIEE